MIQHVFSHSLLSQKQCHSLLLVEKRRSMFSTLMSPTHDKSDSQLSTKQFFKSLKNKTKLIISGIKRTFNDSVNLFKYSKLKKEGCALTYEQYSHIFRTKNDLKTAVPLAVAIIVIPFGGSLAVPVFLAFPHFFTRQFWTDGQMQNIFKVRYEERSSSFTDILTSLDATATSKHLKPSYIKLEDLPRTHLNNLAKMFRISIFPPTIDFWRRQTLEKYLYEYARYIHKSDHLLIKEFSLQAIPPYELRILHDERCLSPNVVGGSVVDRLESLGNPLSILSSPSSPVNTARLSSMKQWFKLTNQISSSLGDDQMKLTYILHLPTILDAKAENCQ